jgi:hypothetical protein
LGDFNEKKELSYNNPDGTLSSKFIAQSDDTECQGDCRSSPNRLNVELNRVNLLDCPI